MSPCRGDVRLHGNSADVWDTADTTAEGAAEKEENDHSGEENEKVLNIEKNEFKAQMTYVSLPHYLTHCLMENVSLFYLKFSSALKLSANLRHNRLSFIEFEQQLALLNCCPARQKGVQGFWPCFININSV